VQRRLDGVMAAARFHGIELDSRDFRALPGEDIPSPAALVTWLRESGLWAKAVRLRWRQLFRFQSDAPLVLLFSDGSAALCVATDATRNVVFLKDPRAAPNDAPHRGG
jgi:ATP-binding cassette subfamily B protein